MEGLDPSQISAEEFAGLVMAAEDAQIEEVIRGVGTQKVLDRIFQGMTERFLPERAEGVDALIQFVITDGDTEHPAALKVSGGAIEAAAERAESPKVTLTTDFVSFAKLVTGKIDGPQLFMTGKLKIAGDLMFSTRIMSLFERPKPPG